MLFMIISIVLVLWYFSIDTSRMAECGYSFRERIFKDPERHPERIGYLIGWPVLTYLAAEQVIPFLKVKLSLGVSVVIALIVIAWVLVEHFRRVSTWREGVPLWCMAILEWYLLVFITTDAMLQIRQKVTNGVDATFIERMKALGVDFLAIIVIALFIAHLIWESNRKNKKREGWLTLLIAGLIILGLILLQLNGMAYLRNKLNEEGPTNPPSPSPTETVTTSDDNQNEKAKLPDPKLVRDIFSDEESVKDLAAKWWSKYQYEYEEDGVKKIGYLMCMHSMPISRDERLFDDALSVPFSTEESWRQEMLDEHLNPFWFYAKASRLILIPEIDETYPVLREYVRIYEEKGPKYFTQGELVTDEYLKYAVAGGLFVNSSEMKLERNVQTETVWRLEHGNDVDPSKLKVVRRDSYREVKPWNDVIVMRHYSDKTGTVYLEYFDLYDRAPVILKEEEKPKVTVTPTAKPTDKPKPSPTDKPDPTPSPSPSPSPTPDPTPSPTDKPKDPTQGTSSTNTEENDNKGTGENTNPTPPPAAQPTPPPESTAEKDTNSTKTESFEDYEKKVSQDKPEPTTKVEAQKSTVPDCDNPGETKEVEGTVFSDEKEAEKPTKEEPLVNVGDDDKPVVNDEENPAGSWRGGGR